MVLPKENIMCEKTQLVLLSLFIFVRGRKMRIKEILKENQPKVYMQFKDKYKFKEEVKTKNSEKLSEEDIKELMGNRRYKRVNGALRQI